MEQTIFDAELNGSPFSNDGLHRHGRPRKDDVLGISLRLRETRGSGKTSAALAFAAVGALWQGRDQPAVPAVFPNSVFNELDGVRTIRDAGHSASTQYAAIRNDAAPSATETGWTAYMREIGAHVAREQHLAAAEIWTRLRQVSSRFPLPQAGLVQDGRFAMAWDVGRLHLDVEINRDGSFDWFYLDRESREADDGERCSLRAPGAFERRARQLAG